MVEVEELEVMEEVGKMVSVLLLNEIREVTPGDAVVLVLPLVCGLEEA